jgi:NAD(P)-dependent dehydrogenase (short-subunit alcohol dehydrogenase family)
MLGCATAATTRNLNQKPREKTMRFQDKVALITAAGAGIGRATANIMAREGAIVVGVDTSEARLDAMVADITAAGGRAHAHCADALDPAQVGAVVAGTARQHGGVDILVNAVGGSTVIDRPSATVDELTFTEWQKLIAFNLEGTFLFTHAAVPVMKQARRGKIINLASIAGRGLSPSSSSAYAAAKGGIIAFTRKLAFELGPFGITINAIAPSLTLSERLLPRWNQRSPDDQAEEMARVPLRRVAQPDDQAKVICFLASSDADFVTGVTIDVTGGQ